MEVFLRGKRFTANETLVINDLFNRKIEKIFPLDITACWVFDCIVVNEITQCVSIFIYAGGSLSPLFEIRRSVLLSFESDSSSIFCLRGIPYWQPFWTLLTSSVFLKTLYILLI